MHKLISQCMPENMPYQIFYFNNYVHGYLKATFENLSGENKMFKAQNLGREFMD